MNGTNSPIRMLLVTAAALIATPAALLAHEGPPGGHVWLAADHAWLAGAAEPLLSPDHFLAGALLVVVVTLVVMRATKVAWRRWEGIGADD